MPQMRVVGALVASALETVNSAYELSMSFAQTSASMPSSRHTVRTAAFALDQRRLDQEAVALDHGEDWRIPEGGQHLETQFIPIVSGGLTNVRNDEVWSDVGQITRHGFFPD